MPENPADPTPPAAPQLKVVSLHDPRGLVDRLRARPTDRLPAAFDPIADLKRGAAAGYEVLLGLDDEAPRSPREWSRGVHLREAGRVEAPLLAAGLAARPRVPAGAILALSLSAEGLVTREVGEVLSQAGRLDGVTIIVTDDTEGSDPRAVAHALDLVRDAGGSIGVDETGSGYASFKQILRLRPDLVRIGQEFVGEIDRDPAKAAIVETLCSFAGRIEASVVAAGVPGTAELDVLRRIGIPLAQGSVFGTPTAEAEPLSAAAARAIREATPAPEPEETVAPLVDTRPAIPWGAPIEDLADAFLEDARHDVLVLVDERRRPLALAERSALLQGEPYERPVMRITPSSPLRSVARRAAARPPLERYHPLVVCDRRGVYLGVVRVEQLLDALAQ